MFKNTTKEQNRDTGMAMVLLCLILLLAKKREGFLIAAMVLLVLNMTIPQIYRPVTVIWLRLSDLLGAISSRVLLSIVFFGIVTPTGLLRRLAGKDSLQLRAFKASKDSVMSQRNHTFVARDLERPF
jgi:hypothetical protein